MLIAISYSLLLGAVACLGVAALSLLIVLWPPRSASTTYDQITLFASSAMLAVLAVALLISGLAK